MNNKCNSCDECNNKPSLVEWFDPDLIDHCFAYRHLAKTGTWPEGFLPKNIHVNVGWQPILAFKLAHRWIEYILETE